MNGGPDSTEHHTSPPQRQGRQGGQSRHGRHRQGTAGTWTPTVPAQPPDRRHGQADYSIPARDPVDAPSSGSLPLPAAPAGYDRAAPPLRRTRRPDHDPGYRSGYFSTQGELPIEVPTQTPPPRPSAADNADKPTVRRRKVTLTAPPEPESLQDTGEDVLVYEAEPVSALDGLGKFDLGSVPASVTPPKTWRKAAWFATVSSGGVVVALLFAGSVLVSQPTETGTQAINDWTERGGQPPTLEGEQFADSSSTPDTGTSARDTSLPPGVSPGPPSGPSSLYQGGPNSSSDRSSPLQPAFPGPTTSVVVTEPPATPTTTPSPEKPPVTPAKRVTNSPKHVLTYDPEVMADNSERFLNTVTEDPAAAHEVTTGELEAEGPEGLERKYQDVAYYEVKKIYIDPNRGETVNTVEVTYPDGSKKTEQRVLHFGEDTKIESDGKSPSE